MIVFHHLFHQMLLWKVVHLTEKYIFSKWVFSSIKNLLTGSTNYGSLCKVQKLKQNPSTETGQQEVHLSSGCAHVHMTKIPCKFLELVIGSMNR
jgi:hypothetical protein